VWEVLMDGQIHGTADQVTYRTIVLDQDPRQALERSLRYLRSELLLWVQGERREAWFDGKIQMAVEGQVLLNDALSRPSADESLLPTTPASKENALTSGSSSPETSTRTVSKGRSRRS
jgi:hypothetical protein